MYRCTLNSIALVSYSETVRPLIRTAMLRAIGSRSVVMVGPMGLKVSEFFARHRVRSPRCHVALAHVVAEREAEQAAERLVLGQVLARRPTTATISPSYSTGPVESRGITMSAPEGTSAFAER